MASLLASIEQNPPAVGINGLKLTAPFNYGKRKLAVTLSLLFSSSRTNRFIEAWILDPIVETLQEPSLACRYRPSMFWSSLPEAKNKMLKR